MLKGGKYTNVFVDLPGTLGEGVKLDFLGDMSPKLRIQKIVLMKKGF